MRAGYATPADRRALEHGCVDWFDYERHALARRGRPGRPRERSDGSRLEQRELERRGTRPSQAAR